MGSGDLNRKKKVIVFFLMKSQGSLQGRRNMRITLLLGKACAWGIDLLKATQIPPGPALDYFLPCCSEVGLRGFFLLGFCVLVLEFSFSATQVKTAAVAVVTVVNAY